MGYNISTGLLLIGLQHFVYDIPFLDLCHEAFVGGCGIIYLDPNLHLFFFGK